MSPAIWLAMARDDLRAAELLAEHGLPPLSRMHADHAVEKALRAFHLHRETHAHNAQAGSSGLPPFPYPSQSSSVDPPGKSPHRLSPGEDPGWIAAALASLSLTAEHRRPEGDGMEAELAREAVEVAHRVLDRITARVYG
jgi:hypothetical protein